MPLNEDELVFVDWVLQKDGGQLKMRIASINNSILETNEEEISTEETNQDYFRSFFAPETQKMRAVDIEYVRWRSAYIIGLNTQNPINEHSSAFRTSWLYWFHSTDDIFEPWIPLSNPQENLGLVNRICCCASEPIIYLLINIFGQSGLLVLNEWGKIHGPNMLFSFPQHFFYS